jgi:hypothetical protein
MKNQQFEEDKFELEMHFQERVRAYVELGETPEQAELSAREKFGETEAVVRELRWQRVLRSPIFWGLICAAVYLLATVLVKAPWVSVAFFFSYALYLWRADRTPRRDLSGR